MADGQLPVMFDQEYRVKLGRSFTFPKENAFHTIKYDFKPKSVDPTKPGRMKVNGDEVSVSLPVTQAGSLDDVILFKGAKRTCAKECILIINTTTGEAILEKLTNTVQVKGVRDPKKKKQQQTRSISPLPAAVSKPQSNTPAAATNSRTNESSLTTTTPAPPPSAVVTSEKKVKRTKKANKTKSQSQQQVSTKPVAAPPPLPTTKMSSLNSSLSLPESISPLRSNNPTPEPHPPSTKKAKAESLSSSGTDSSSSSSDSDSDDTMDFTSSSHVAPPTTYASMPQFTSHPPTSLTSMPEGGGSHVTTTNMGKPTNGGTGGDEVGGNLSDSSSSDSSSSEESSSSDSPKQQQIQAVPVLTATNATVFDVRPRSMSLLKKDLEMSESDSD